MSETLMTEQAATTTEGAAASTQATESATGAEQGGQQQQATEGQTTEGQQAEGAKTEDAQEKPAGAPETYEFKAAEGVTFDAAVITQFSEVAKELNLPQDAAQKMLDKMAPAIAARQVEQMETIRNEWAASAKADKEFGGDKLDESLAVATKTLDTFGSPELRTLLNESGLGNHPEVIRFMVKTGKAISEDRFVSGSGGNTTTQSVAQRMYPGMNP